ncbi:MAG TPA: AlkA N-terminal domain-containing protein [Solirubrobacteraceae bacterium]|nr:AlkA N-terminal domain-containing protein [Solirubrobacteraceae bacterium]
MSSRTVSPPIRLRLPFQPPIDLDGLIAFLGRRAVAGVEEILPAGGYRRSVRLPRGPGVIELHPPRKPGYVEAAFRLHDHRDLGAAVQQSRKLLDLDRDPYTITEVLGDDAVIGPLVRATPGRRVPGHVDPHELALRAVLGQQISVAAATTHAARIVAAYGGPLDPPVGAVTHLFPTTAAVADADPGALAMPTSRQRTLVTLAAALATGELSLDGSADPALTERDLLALPGIGPWTAAYIAMRVLGDADAFLPTDLGVRRGLEALGYDGRPVAAVAMAENWRPYRAYAVQHLWAAATAPHPARTTTQSPTSTPQSPTTTPQSPDSTPQSPASTPQSTTTTPQSPALAPHP